MPASHKRRPRWLATGGGRGAVGEGQWGGWIPIGSGVFASDPQAVATSDGHDQIFANTNGTLQENWFSPGTGTVGGWVQL